MAEGRETVGKNTGSVCEQEVALLHRPAYITRGSSLVLSRGGKEPDETAEAGADSAVEEGHLPWSAVSEGPKPEKGS